MSANADITFAWADGKNYKFALPIGQLEELQEATGAGPEELLHRLTILPAEQGGAMESIRLGLLRPGPRDLREILRLGLIGGGTKPDRAAIMVSRYVDGRPRLESYLPARLVLSAAIVGVPGDPVGKSDAGETTPPTDQTTQSV